MELAHKKTRLAGDDDDVSPYPDFTLSISQPTLSGAGHL